MKQILIVEDNRPVARSYLEILSGTYPDVSISHSGHSAWQMMKASPPEVVLLDLSLPDMNGLELLTQAKDSGMPTTFVIVTADGSINQAVEAIKKGADDFVVKPVAPNRLLVTVKNAFERNALESEVRTYREILEFKGLGEMIGTSAPMQAVYTTIQAAAPTEATVFITGQSGTGKELCAQAIHSLSARAKGPIVTLNCAAIPRDLIESEIFGHKKGAFTSASESRTGAAGQAKGGTLFLDEICELDVDLQSKLLRFVQTGTYQRVGDSVVESANVRIVCATNRDPWAEVGAGRFREDLYYRLHVIPIEMPSLAERGGDVIILADEFLRRFSKEANKKFEHFTPECQDILLAHSWPGNVREMENLIHRIVVLNDGPAITPEMLPPDFVNLSNNLTGFPSTVQENDEVIHSATILQPLWKVEKEAIESAIAFCNGSIPKAAAILKVSPSTIYRKREAWLTEEKLSRDQA